MRHKYNGFSRIIFALSTGFLLFSLWVKAGESVIIVMDADTGKIIRMDNPVDAMQSTFPPGSVIKLYTALFGLKENIISPSTTFHCNGFYKLGGENLDCWDKKGHGAVDLYRGISESCNVFFYQVSQLIDSIGYDEYFRFLRSFGFGKKTGIDWPEEAMGTLPEYGDYLEKVKAASGISRQLLVTPIQMITAFAVVVNGGKVVVPTLGNKQAVVKEKLEYGECYGVIRKALWQGAETGTSAGYFQATGGYAKTGTAPGEDWISTHAWFVGYLPLKTRNLVILVFKMKGSGSKDALPVGRQVAEELKKLDEDGEIVSVSLFSILKPKQLDISGRFGLLSITGEGEEGITKINAKALQVNYGTGGILQLITDGGEPQIFNHLEIKNSQPQGVIEIRQKNSESREYKGSISIKPGSGYLETNNILRLGDYLEGVIGCEMGMVNENEPPSQKKKYLKRDELLKVQAILSRTFALNNLKRHGDTDFCDTTHCQHYVGNTAGGEIIRGIISETSGQVLIHEGKLCSVFYHSTCGGFTTSYYGVWEDKEIPYLKPVDDGERCGKSPHYRWTFEVDENRLFDAIKNIFGQRPLDIVLKEEDSAGWIKKMTLIFPGKREIIMKGEDFHIKMGRIFGWNNIKSANFTLQKNGSVFTFLGKGLGHGVGLCQYGARELALSGRNCVDILRIYFPGTEIDNYGTIDEKFRTALSLTVSTPGFNGDK